jgi:hypothetical protein
LLIAVISGLSGTAHLVEAIGGFGFGAHALAYIGAGLTLPMCVLLLFGLFKLSPKCIIGGMVFMVSFCNVSKKQQQIPQLFQLLHILVYIVLGILLIIFSQVDTIGLLNFILRNVKADYS